MCSVNVSADAKVTCFRLESLNCRLLICPGADLAIDTLNFDRLNYELLHWNIF